VSASHILIATKTAESATPQVAGWKMTALSGKHLKHAQVVFDPQSGEPTVQLTWNSDGEKLFGDITGANIGKQLGIFLDGQLISAPTVQAKITGGTAVISGNFTLEETKTLARRLNAGALPVPITLVTQQTVDATLGSASLEKSLFAGLVGFLAVVLFMLLVYRLPGLMAALALCVYTALTLAVFKFLGVTMTLAGIAGFILSIGMAVDANVLIFERVKEELRNNRTVGEALSEGFKRAWNSIRDSNISSLITCGILIWFGTSTVRGFAITLAIGILLSMFTAIIVTRNFMRSAIGERIGRHLWLIGSGLKHKTEEKK
jgi:preprotein translocase subunit SecD